jgi:hypothetical protein
MSKILMGGARHGGEGNAEKFDGRNIEGNAENSDGIQPQADQAIFT